MQEGVYFLDAVVRNDVIRKRGITGNLSKRKQVKIIRQDLKDGKLYRKKKKKLIIILYRNTGCTDECAF